MQSVTEWSRRKWHSPELVPSLPGLSSRLTSQPSGMALIGTTLELASGANLSATMTSLGSTSSTPLLCGWDVLLECKFGGAQKEDYESENRRQGPTNTSSMPRTVRLRRIPSKECLHAAQKPPPYLGGLNEFLGQIDLVLLNEGGTHRVALSTVEGEDHSTPARHGSGECVALHVNCGRSAFSMGRDGLSSKAQS